MPPHDFGRQPLERLGIGDVETDGLGAKSPAGQVQHCRVRMVAAGCRHDGGALRREAGRDGLTDATRRAGDERHFAGQENIRL